MRLVKTRVRNLNQYLSAFRKGAQFRIAHETEDPDDLTGVGFSAVPAAGATILPAIVGPVTQFNAEGKWQVHRDQPKEPRYVRTVLWRWKQWAGRGQTEEHEEFRDVYRDCYPRDWIEAPAAEVTFLMDDDGVQEPEDEVASARGERRRQ